MKITVLGAGLVGQTIVRDLNSEKEFHVTVADINQDALDDVKKLSTAKTIVVNLLEDGAIEHLVADQDLVVSAVPGSISGKGKAFISP